MVDCACLFIHLNCICSSSMYIWYTILQHRPVGIYNVTYIQYFPRCSLYGAGHDDPPGHGGVPPVSDHHPGLPALRHAAEVHVQERLALATHDMWLLRGIQRHGRYLVTPLGDLHNLINVRIPSEIEPRKDQFSIYFNLQRI